MFKLTNQEQWILAFLVAALVLGTVVREWRARHQSTPPPALMSEPREQDG